MLASGRFLAALRSASVGVGIINQSLCETHSITALSSKRFGTRGPRTSSAIRYQGMYFSLSTIPGAPTLCLFELEVRSDYRLEQVYWLVRFTRNPIISCYANGLYSSAEIILVHCSISCEELASIPNAVSH